MSWGDFPLGETLNHFFTTRAFATGIPTVLAGTPVLSVYEDTNLTQITAGVTVTVDADSVVGLNRANIVATSGNGYETNKSYTIVITTGTVGGVSVVGEVVGTFTVERGAAFIRLGAPVAASISADIAVVDLNVDQIETAVITNAAGADVAADIIALKAETVLIVADTNELQTDDVPTLISNLDAVVDTVKVDTAAILVDTGTTIPATITTVDTVVDGIQTDLDNATDGLGAIKTDTAAILVDTNTTIPGTITTIDTVVDGIQTDLSNATDGLGAIKADTAAVLVDTGTTIPATITTVDTVVDGIQTDLSNATDGLGALKALIDAIQVVVDKVPLSDGTVTWNATALVSINDQVVDVINTDTSGEPAQGIPAATASLRTKIDFLYKNWRNRKTQTATQWNLFNDNGTTIDHKATVSDDATTADKTEIVSGP